jgi:hypothetical protein
MSLAALALASHLSLATHPSVLYAPADVTRLRHPPTPAAQEIHDALVAGAGYASSAPGSSGYGGEALYAFALDCAFTGDATICQGAHDWLTWLVAQPQWEGSGTDPVDFVEANDLLGTAIAYDVLSDPSGTIPAGARLDDATRATVRQRLAVEAARVFDQTASGQHPTWWANEYLQNHNWFDVSSLAVAAIALNGDLSPDPTCDWLAAAVDDYTKVDQGLRRIADGTWHEGYSYEGSSIMAWLGFVIPFERARTAGTLTCSGAAQWPDFADVPFFHAWPHTRAVSSLPGREHQAVVMHGDWFGWSADQVAMTYRYAAARFGDGEAEWLAQAHLKASPHDTWGYEQEATALEYLVYDPTVVAKAPTATDVFLSDLQGYVARSGWTGDAKVLGVKAGAFGGTSNWAAVQAGQSPAPDIDFGHDHDDDLGFWLYGDGQWLAPEADGYALHGYCSGSSPHVWNTSYHNTLTVDGVGQMGDDETCRDTGDGKVPWSRAGGVTAHASVRDHVYVAMDGTALYPASLGLDLVRRQVLFLDRRCVVVRDTLRAAAPHTWEWHVHALDSIVQDGSWLRGESKNDVALAVRMVTPSAWGVEVTSDALPHGPNAGTYIDPDEDIAHARVYVTAPTAAGRFLAVMCPATVSGWSARSDVQSIGDAASARGFAIATAQSTGAWLFADEATAAVTDGAQRSLTGMAGGVETAGAVSTYVLVNGSAISDAGHEVLSGDAQSGAIEAVVGGSTVDVSADGATHARVYAPDAKSATWNGTPATMTRDPSDARYVLIEGNAGAGGDGGAGAGAGTGASDDAGARTDAGASSGTAAGPGAPPGTPSNPTSGGGCGCDAAGSGDSPTPWIAALVTLLALARRPRARGRTA